AGARAHTIAVIERAILRGPRPSGGSSGLVHALAVFRGELTKLRRGESCDLHFSDPRVELRDYDLAAAGDLLERLAKALAPLEQIEHSTSCSFRAMAARHRDVVAALSCDNTGEILALSGADGNALALALEDIAGQPADADLT